jgi:uncharacterized protein (UPF0333 family)
MTLRGQVSFEFIMVLFVVVLITVAFGIIAGNRLTELKSQQANAQMQNVAVTVKNEIDIARSVEAGYVRTFSLPDYLGNKDYAIGIQNNFVTVSIEDNQFSLAVQPVNGTVQKGFNVISKVNNSVVLNG